MNGGYAPRVRVSTSFSYPSLVQNIGLFNLSLPIGASAESAVTGL